MCGVVWHLRLTVGLHASQPSSRVPFHPLPLLRHVEKTDL